MIHYDRFVLDNGLRVLVHRDNSTQRAAVNILYDVGARDENPEKTGFAHLFEHLMFGGSANIEKYDYHLERAGGENNAFTSNDITNYYITLPAVNLETAFWLESDRMLNLAFSENSLAVQRNVVIEEFKEGYFNQPYGDVWLLLRPLAYKVHPYQWATIGKEISHIANASLDDVKEFFKRFYCPDNAIMVVSGNVETEQIKTLCEKWFSSIPKGADNKRNLPAEPPQEQARLLEVERDVPSDAIFKTWHCSGRSDLEFYTEDMITDILSRGKSSRFYTNLYKKKKLFTQIDAYHSGDIDKGLIVVEGMLRDGVSFEEAEKAIEEELNALIHNELPEDEFQKVKNNVEATLEFSEMNVLNKAMDLAFAELLGDAGMVNKQVELYKQVTAEQIRQSASEIFRDENCSTLRYKSKK